MFNIYDDGLAEALLYSRKDIAILYGSPLSTFRSSDGIRGVDNVSGVVKLITKFITINYPKLSEKYHNVCLSEKFSDIEKYQKSFEFLHQFTDPAVPNEIIRQAVMNAYEGKSCDYKNLKELRACEKDVFNWQIPPAIEYLASILKFSSKFSGPVITTNFDPLLKIALEKIEEDSSSIVFHNDGSLEKQIDDRLKVVHIHGHWLESDTLHTSNQLTFKRVQLTNSLKKILRNKTLFIIGYGAWEDVFVNALKEVAEDDDVDLNIIWAFYESCETTIKSKYKNLIDIIKPVITRGRFRAYGGIDGHTFLDDFYSKLNVTTDANSDVVVNNEVVNNEVEIIKETPKSDLNKWFINVDPVNYVIRTTERELIKEYISKNRIINLVSDWGVSKDEFIFSALNIENEVNFSFFKVDLSGVDSVDDFLDTFKDNFGVEVQQFITKLPREDNIVVFDAFSSSNDYLIKKVIDIANAMMDYNSFTRVIICSDTVIEGNIIKVFKLGRLEEFDCIKYVNFFLDETLSEDALDSLIELSSGVPQYLKKLVEDLEYGNLKEVINNNSQPAEIIEGSEDNIPKEIIRRVELLASSEDSHSQRSYALLKKLCLLKYGDTYSNLKQMGEGYNFKITHLKQLYKLGLTNKSGIGTSIEIKVKSISEDKIHEVKELVREYLFTKMTESEIKNFLKIIANTHFGVDWKLGAISLSTQNRKLLGLSGKFALSLKYVAVSLLRISAESDNSSLLKESLKLCLSYGTLLMKENRYKQFLSFFREIKNITNDQENASALDMMAFFQKEIVALRMLSRADEALLVYDSIKDKISSFKNTDKTSVYLNLAFIYEKKKKFNDAKNFAMEVQSLTTKGQSSFEQAQLIIESGSSNISDLKKAELKNRNANNISVANNTALDIVKKTTDNRTKLKYLNRVISSNESKKDRYNTYRAIVKKVIILEGKLDFKLSEGTLLSDAYSYSFGQRMKGLFKDAHQAIWQHFYSKNDFENLNVLFKQSSIYWRIYDDEDSERKYALLLELLNNGIKFSKLDPYTRIRLKALKSCSPV